MLKFAIKKVLLLLGIIVWIVIVSMYAAKYPLFDLGSRVFCTLVFFTTGITSYIEWMCFHKRREDKYKAILFLLLAIGYGTYIFGDSIPELNSASTGFDWLIGFFLLYQYREKKRG